MVTASRVSSQRVRLSITVSYERHAGRSFNKYKFRSQRLGLLQTEQTQNCSLDVRTTLNRKNTKILKNKFLHNSNKKNVVVYRLRVSRACSRYVHVRLTNLGFAGAKRYRSFLPVFLPDEKEMGVHKYFDSDNEEQSSPSAPLENVALVSESGSISKPANVHSNPTLVRSRVSKRSGALQKPVGAQIRMLERLLKHGARNIPSAVRKQKEQQLTELRRLAGEKNRRQVESSIAKKYHMVRFFERRKLERILHALQQKEKTGPENEKKKAQIIKDLTYVRHFPKGRKYVALFPKGGHTEESRAKVEAIRAEVERLLKGSSVVGATASSVVPESAVSNGNGDCEGNNDKEDRDNNNVEETDDFFLDVAAE